MTESLNESANESNRGTNTESMKDSINEPIIMSLFVLSTLLRSLLFFLEALESLGFGIGVEGMILNVCRTVSRG